MDNDSIRRILEEEEIGLREVAFLVALPFKKATFERMKPSGFPFIGRNRELLEGISTWEVYEDQVVNKVMPMLVDLYRETGVAAITDLTFSGFREKALDEKYKLIILAAHHSQAKGKTEFLDGLVSDKKVMDVLAKHKKAGVFDLCRFGTQAESFKKDKTYRQLGPVAYAHWNIPIIEGIFFLTTWVKCLKTHPTLSRAYDEAVRRIVGILNMLEE